MLDELRKTLSEISMKTAEDTRDYDRDTQLFGVFDTFAAARPHLVDLTTCGPQCPACFDWGWYDSGGEGTHKYECLRLRDKAPTGQSCPVLKEWK